MFMKYQTAHTHLIQIHHRVRGRRLGENELSDGLEWSEAVTGLPLQATTVELDASQNISDHFTGLILYSQLIYDFINTDSLLDVRLLIVLHIKHLVSLWGTRVVLLVLPPSWLMLTHSS